MKLGILVLCSSVLLVASGCSSGPAESDQDGLRVVKDGKPEGSVAMDKDEMSKKEGIPIYPGAEIPEGKSTVSAGVTETRYELQMVTKDPMNKVVDFYKGKIPALKGAPNNNTIELLGETPSKTLAHITITSGGGKTTIKAAAIVEQAAKP